MDALVRALLEPAAYDHPVATIELLETHISWIFLTGPYAYKVKKPVQFGFVDFSTPERRRLCCEEELRLNRRLAPDLYLDVVSIHGPIERASLHGGGPTIEAAVRMQQFRQQDLLPEALARQELPLALLDRLARELAAFHCRAAVVPPSAPWGRPELVLEPALANFDALESVGRLPPDHAGLRHWTIQEHERLTPLLLQRRCQGWIRECHGDLHLGNMALHGGRITVFDGIEFSEALRWIDPISDLAFLLMDLRRRGHPDLALRVLQGWLDGCGDHGGLRLLCWYLAYRGLVRAKVTALRLDQAGLSPADQNALERDLDLYLAAARRAINPCRGSLLITHGVSGSGKSHAAAELRAKGWLQVRSDLERQRLFGRLDRGPDLGNWSGDTYAAEVSAHLYSKVLAEAARAALDAGLAVVIDATFLRREQRQLFQQLAREAGAGFGILAPAVSAAVAEQRIKSRRLKGSDPSEADVSVLQRQWNQIEPLLPEEQRWLLSGVDDPRLHQQGRALSVPA